MKTQIQTRQPTALPHVTASEFEGPYDVLLDMAQQRKVDISLVSLRQITDDFLTYISEHTIATEHQLDFVLVTNTLLLLKIQRALPNVSEEEAEELTTLTDRLRLYQLYRDQAVAFRSKWLQAPLFTSGYKAPSRTYAAPEITGADLATAFERVVATIASTLSPTRHLRSSGGKSLAQCMTLFRERLRLSRETTFASVTQRLDRQSAAVAFLAMLELTKQGVLVPHQSVPFSPIDITSR